ncbi:MAG TPA: hypothetical protein VJR89_35405 [Polyangiales bacterium]|nr:hypothetical protein [Polyangiales bacterium]
MNARRWIAILLATGIAGALVPAAAQDAQPSPEVARAEAFATEAYQAYERKEYERAVELYQQALAAAPSADIIYNLARIYDSKLRDRKRAIEFYERYTLDTGAEPNRVRTANERLAELRELDSVANEQPREAPQPAAAAVSARPEAPAPAQPPPPKARGGLNGVQLAGLISGAAGIAALGVGVGFGIAAKSDADVAHEMCDGNQCSTQEGVDAALAADRAATVSTVAFIAGGTLVAIGVTFLLVGSSGGSQEHARLSVSPAAGPGLLGLRTAGTF